MGGATSKFGDTDWDKVDGGLSSVDETIDKNKPTSRHIILSLNKLSAVNQREYEIKDDQDIMLYKTKSVEGTVKWFDLFGNKGNEKLFRIQVDDKLHKYWTIYQYDKPIFADQQPDLAAEKKGNEGKSLYRLAQIQITFDRYHGNVIMYGLDENKEDLCGVLINESTLKVEEIKGVTAQYQSYNPPTTTASSITQQHPPLVGYWTWESTLKLHQMKMHLAKGTDIALHIILAVITNMVRIERNTGGLSDLTGGLSNVVSSS